MKRLIFLSTLLIFALASTAQPLLIPKGVKALTYTITPTEVSYLHGITGKPMTQAEADARYPQISEGDPTPIYTEVEVNVLLKQARKSELLKTLQAQGSAIKAIPAGASSLFYGALPMNESRAFQATYIIEDTLTITGVGYMMVTAQGNFTTDADFNGFFLCSVSGANYAVVAQTANDGNIWKVAINTYSTKEFISPVVLVPGVYKLFGVYNNLVQTTQPQIMIGQGIGGNTYNQLLTNGHKMEGYITGATITVPAAPFASSTVTSSASQPSFVLY